MWYIRNRGRNSELGLIMNQARMLHNMMNRGMMNIELRVALMVTA